MNDPHPSGDDHGEGDQGRGEDHLGPVDVRRWAAGVGGIAIAAVVAACFAVSTGPDPVLVGAGDIASCDSADDERTAKLLDGIAGTVFTAGDNVYPDGTATEFATCYSQSWGRHLERTRPVPGNHDYYTLGAAGYKDYFGSAATPSGPTWYAFDLGTWRIYALDSECLEIGGCGPTSPQGRWLAADLDGHSRRCVAAIWHVPLFTSAIRRGDERMRWVWQALERAGSDVVVNGHSHHYERFAPQRVDGSPSSEGMRQFIVGTGGIRLRPLGSPARNSEVRWNAGHGVLALTLHPAGYSWRFVPVEGSTFSDSGTSACV